MLKIIILIILLNYNSIIFQCHFLCDFMIFKKNLKKGDRVMTYLSNLEKIYKKP